MNTNEQFRAMAEEIFGEDCSRPTSRLLDANHRTVQRWLSGAFDIPDGIFAEMTRHHATYRCAFPKLQLSARAAATEVDREIYAVMIRKIGDPDNLTD
jgi:hypothetical protein